MACATRIENQSESSNLSKESGFGVMLPLTPRFTSFVRLAMRPKTTPFRLTELLVAIGLVVAALIWSGRAAWRQISGLRSGMTVEQIASFRSADQLRAAILQSHAEWRGTFESANLTNRARMEAVGSKTRQLIATKVVSARSPTERDLVNEISIAFEDYYSRLTKSLLAGMPDNKLSPAAAHNVETGLERMLALTERLAVINQTAAQHFVTDANAALTRLQRLLFASLAALLIAGALIVVIAYRRTIAPLRSTLTENRAVMERQEKLASLGIFATGIAHEIRNPLTAIKVRLFSLKASHRPGTSEREDTEVIENEIDRLERIVRDFLQFARPTEPELQTMQSGKLLQDASDLLASNLAKKSVGLKLDLVANESVRVDPSKMKQVLINFIQNAADSMEGGGIVTLRSRTSRQTLNGRTVPVVVLDIADTGKGMPPDVQKRLFDPFFTTKEDGTGLGLPISARIVEKHGGVIRYETQPGRGTTFSIVLPVVQKEENES